MNYFPWHIGDYAAHTGHLEPMEDLIYRRLLDAYYLREGPLPADVQTTAKLIRLRSISADVEAVLQEFFELTDDGWRHSRCDEEIAKMLDKQAKARDAAELSVKSRKAAAERRLAEQQASAERAFASTSTDVELPTPTPTPTPEEKTGETRSRAPNPSAFRPDDVSEQVWGDFLALRKQKKAPVTETVIRQASIEARKAGLSLDQFLTVWCARGSQGLQADWLKPHERGQGPVQNGGSGRPWDGAR